MINIYFPGFTDEFHSIYRKFRILRNKNIQLWVTKEFLERTCTSTPSDVKRIDIGIKIKHKFDYIEWNSDSYTGTSVEESYKYLYERIQKDEIWAIIREKPNKKDMLSMFQECTNDDSYPQEWKKAKCFNDWTSIYSFCQQKGAIKFELCEGNRFTKASDINPVKGAVVYREKGTGLLWHKNTFHKNHSTSEYEHCEVYNSQGEHIGEAPLETGIINYSKKDKTKHINIK